MPHQRFRFTRHNREFGFIHVVLLLLFFFSATTFGVVTTQAQLQARTAKQDLKTTYALQEAKKGLLDFARGDGLSPSPTEYGRIPKVDAFVLEHPSSRNNFAVFSRVGQLPCPDNLGDLPVNVNVAIAAYGESDGNLDGTADYPEAHCYGTTATVALEHDAYVGRLPWREYFSYSEAIRAVYTGEGDGFDGNADRLWYAVSPNLTRQNRPLNQYRLTRIPDNWFTVHVQPFAPVSVSVGATLHNLPIVELTVDDVAALVISPGITNSLQTQRYFERDLFSRDRVALSVRARDQHNQFLDDATFLLTSNQDLDYAFTKPVGEFPPYIDEVEYIRRDEILAIMAEAKDRNVDAHLDEIADGLAAFYKRHRYLPDPTTFARANANFLSRRFSTPHQLSSLVLSYELFQSRPPYGSPYLQGAALKYNNASAVWANAGTLSVVTGRDAVSEGVIVNLAQSDLPLIIPSRPPELITTAIGQTDLYLPTFGGGIHFGGTLDTANFGGDLIGMIPPLTPFRAADSFMAPYNPHQPEPELLPGRLGNFTTDFGIFLQDAFAVANPRRVKTDPSGALNQLLRYLGNVNPLLAGVYDLEMRGTVYNQPALSVFTTNFHGNQTNNPQPFRPNVRTANFGQVNSLYNLLKHGYNTIIPKGTWLVSTATITVFGNGNDHRSVAGSLIGPTQYAFRAVIPDNTFVNPGNSFNLSVVSSTYAFFGATNNITFSNVRIPENTPVVAGSQGLLPSQILPDQLRGSDLADIRWQERWDGFLAPFLLRTANEKAAVIIDPHGGYGSFPAEVTMHPLHDASLSFVAPSGPDNASRGSNYRIRNSFALRRAYVEPTPLLSYDAVAGATVLVEPHPLQIEGYITFPEGSRFYYPPGTMIPMGQNSFNHGHNDYIFDHPFNASSTLTGLTAYAKAYLAPGAVIHNSRFILPSTPAGGYILPSGGIASTSPGFSPATSRNQYLVTLVNGGVLYFDQLLHYTAGDLTMLPKTPAQRAFRVESNGLRFIDPEHPSFDAANIGGTFSGHNFVGNANSIYEALYPNRVYGNHGYYLFPYLSSFEERSVALPPVLIPEVDATTVNVANFTPAFGETQIGSNPGAANSYVDAPISRSDVLVYNTGRNASAEVTLSLVRNTWERNTTAGGGVFNLIDSRGLGVLETTGENAATTFAAATTALASITYTEAITLNKNLGVSLMANPGRYSFTYHDSLSPVNLAASFATISTQAGLALAQFGHTTDTSPLVLPTAPDTLVPDLVSMAVAVSLSTTVVAGVTSTTAITTDFVDARAAQLGLNWPESATFTTSIGLNNFSVPISVYSNEAVDLIELGETVDESTHAIMQLDSDAFFALIQPAVSPPGSHRIPKGSNLEVGWLENFLHIDGATLSYFTPGMKAVNGVGFYPAPATANLRMHRDTASFTGPSSMTLFGIGPLGLTATITLSEPRVLLPAGRNIARFNHEVPLLLSNTITVTNTVTGPPLVTNTVTSTLTYWANPVCSTVYACTNFDSDLLFYDAATVVMPADYASIYVVADTTTGLADLDFQFVANEGGGALVAEVSTGVATTVDHVIENLNQGQIMRLRMAEQLVPGATITVPEVIPWMDISWQNRDNNFGYGDIPHDSLIFNQNNPLFYAVADDCRVDLLQDPLDCSFESDRGLTVNVPPGEFVRLPEDTIAPAGMMIYGRNAFQSAHNFLNIGFVDDLSASSTPTPQYQVPAIRVNRNGHIELYEMGTSPNVYERTGTIITEAGRRYGTFAVVYPGNNTFGGNGFAYQYVPDDVEAGTVTLTSPVRDHSRSYIDSIYPTRAGVNTNDELLYIRLGGFTKGSETQGTFKTTVAIGASLTLGFRSTIRYDNNSGTKSIILGDQSSAPGAFGDLTGWHEVSGTPNLQLTVASMAYGAVQFNQGLNLPKLIPAGSPLYIHNNIIATAGAVSIARLYAETIAPGTTIRVPPTGRVMQALIRARNQTITTATTPPTTITLRSTLIGDRLRDDAIFYTRSVATTDAGIQEIYLPGSSSSVTISLFTIANVFTLTTTVTTYSTTTVTIDFEGRTLAQNGIPTYFNQSLIEQTISGSTLLGVTNYVAGPPITITTPPLTAYSCWYCGRPLRIDISHYATATTTITLADGSLHDTFAYPLTLYNVIYQSDDDVNDGVGEITYGPTTFGDYHASGVIVVFGNVPTTDGPFAHQDRYMDFVINTPLNRIVVSTTTVNVDPRRNSFYSFTGGMSFSEPGRPINSTATRQQNLNAYVGDVFETAGLTQNTYTLATDMRENSVLAINQLGNFEYNITIGTGSNDYALEMPDGMRMALFGNVTIPPMRLFSSSQASLINAGDATEFSQLFVDGDWNFRLQNIDEIAFQLPTSVTIPGHGVALPGSMIYPLSGQLLKARRFNSVNPFTITLNASGAIGNIVGGGGVGQMYEYTFSPNIHLERGGIGLWTTTSLTRVQNYIVWNLPNNPSLTVGLTDFSAQTVIVHPRQLFINHPTITATGLEARTHGAILARNLRQITPTSTVTITTSVTSPYSRYQRFVYTESYSSWRGWGPAGHDNNLMDQLVYEFLPAQHRLTFAANAELEIRPAGVNYCNTVTGLCTIPFGEYFLPAGTTVNFHSPTPTTLTLPGTPPSTNTIYAAWSRTADVSEMRVIPAIYGHGHITWRHSHALTHAPQNLSRTNDLEPGQADDVSTSANPMYQNLWVQTQGTLTIVEPNGTTLVLPENSIINPLQGTYLPADISPPEETYEIVETTGATPMRTLTELVFAPPALVLPAGITVNAGTIGLQFEEVKAVVAYSSAPLRPDPALDSTLTTPNTPAAANLRRNNYINCTETNFGTPQFNEEVFVNQYAEHPYYDIATPTVLLGSNNIPDFVPYFTGTWGARVTTIAGVLSTLETTIPSSLADVREIVAHSYAHPCVMLDIEENFDADQTFVYTSGMLERPRTIAGTYSTPSLVRVNDRMRMIGGQLQP